MSIRTAHRYLMDLSEMGVPLYTEPGRGGGYRILNNRMLTPIILDEDEAFAIFFAFQSLRYYPSMPFDINMNSISRKLYASLPADAQNKIDRLESVLAFWTHKTSNPSPFLKEIIEAATENRILEMVYASKADNTVREIVPLGLYAYNGFWYMPAFDPAAYETRLFRADRIVLLKVTQDIAVPPVNLPSWLDNQTAQAPKNPVRLYVELTREGIRQCRSQPWLEPYIVTTDEVYGYVETEIDQSELEFVSSYFFQLGTSAKVLEPREIADRIGMMAKELYHHYL
ncbi:YafY family protein [Paenibacillus sp. J22TS3]|uniref:helix-turn-helix transcriptional regulator n=1 Tax=Paenibacillus sp. J22TS3 TaxID=2807192 RepID=UPI002795CC5F|nr:YafY family protein [Paenibacillus sp. J22TS3]